MSHEFRQVHAQTCLHWEPKVVVHRLLLRDCKAHHEVVAHQIRLFQRCTFEVEAFKYEVGIIGVS